MAIKISYIFLKSYAITKGINLKATDGFYFNDNSPIKALRKTYFIKEENNIILDTITVKKEGEFSLPTSLNDTDFTEDNLPLYILPAV